MIAGLTRSSNGNVIIDKLSLDTGIDDIYKKIGVFPEFEALHDTLNIRYHLELCASFKGIPKDEQKDVID